MNKKIILIIGPTATGKTKLSISLAKHFNLPILNADSLLFYKELSIGVAKPTLEEIEGVPHHLLDVASISSPLNAMDFCKLALPYLENKDPIIICGGSGFYIKALLYGMYESPTTSPEILKRSELLYKELGINPFIEILKENDYESFQKLHHNDHYRIRRAVEHWWMTDIPISTSHKNKMTQNQTFPFWKQQGWELLPLYIDIPKEIHLDIIKTRTKHMIKMGLIDEVKKLLLTFQGHEKPLQSIGYKEVQYYLQGTISSIEQLEESIIVSTRQLAKSQRTWFATMEKIGLNYPHFFDEALIKISQFLD